MLTGAALGLEADADDASADENGRSVPNESSSFALDAAVTGPASPSQTEPKPISNPYNREQHAHIRKYTLT